MGERHRHFGREFKRDAVLDEKGEIREHRNLKTDREH